MEHLVFQYLRRAEIVFLISGVILILSVTPLVYLATHDQLFSIVGCLSVFVFGASALVLVCSATAVAVLGRLAWHAGRVEE